MKYLTKKINNEEFWLVSGESGVNKIGAEKIKEYYKFIGCKVRMFKKNDEYDVYARKTYETPFTYTSYNLGHSRANERSALINKFSMFGITSDEKADELIAKKYYPEAFFDILLGFVKSYYTKQDGIRKQSNKIYASDEHYYPKQEVIVYLNPSEISILKKSKIPYKISNPKPDYIGVISVSMTVENARKLIKKI